MLGLMQNRPLLVSSILVHAARHHGEAEVVSREADGSVVRASYAEVERRARKLARALQALGVGPSDRVATLAWNSQRHLELYYAVCGMGSVVHTVNPRLSPDDIVHILNDAGSVVLCADAGFLPMVDALRARVPALRQVVVMAAADAMPETDALCYETVLAGGSEDYDWPVLDENLASALCYTSGTTGRPKGVLYSQSQHHGARLRDQPGRRFRVARDRSGDAGGAHVSRQCLGPALCRADGGRQPGDAWATAGRGLGAGVDECGAGDVLRRACRQCGWDCCSTCARPGGGWTRSSAWCAAVRPARRW